MVEKEKEAPAGFFARLTPEQQKAALEYRGEENHGTYTSDRIFDGTRSVSAGMLAALRRAYYRAVGRSK